MSRPAGRDGVRASCACSLPRHLPGGIDGTHDPLEHAVARHAGPTLLAHTPPLFPQALGGALIVIGQCLALTTKTDLPPRQYGEAVAVLVLVALLLVALPAAAPRAFERVRLLVAGGVRLLLFAQPVVRHPRGLLTVFQVRRRGAGQPLRGAWFLLQVTRRPAIGSPLQAPLQAPLPARSSPAAACLCTAAFRARRARRRIAPPAFCSTSGACCWAAARWQWSSRRWPARCPCCPTWRCSPTRCT